MSDVLVQLVIELVDVERQRCWRTDCEA